MPNTCTPFNNGENLGWKAEEGKYKYQSGTATELFPSNRKGSLDKEKLHRYGLTADRIREKNALFFYQLVLPLHYSSMSGVHGDKRKSFYPLVTSYINIYSNTKNDGYGHQVERIRHDEIVHFNGVMFIHDVCGGSSNNIGSQWASDNCLYHKLLAEKIKDWRWREIEENLKLCNNCKEEFRVPFNPANKFDLVYQTIVNNSNYLTKKACLNLVIDESTWAYYGYGGELVNYLKNKMVTKGGQSVILMDTDRLRPRGILLRNNNYKYATCFTRRGQSEVYELMTKCVLPEIGPGKIWSEAPDVTIYNFFNGDAIFDWIGGMGLSMTGTVARKCLPKGVTTRYFHKNPAPDYKKSKARVVVQLCSRIVYVQRFGFS
eukprot:jgi/Psemu1/12394/gm1.12394_g